MASLPCQDVRTTPEYVAAFPKFEWEYTTGSALQSLHTVTCIFYLLHHFCFMLFSLHVNIHCTHVQVYDYSKMGIYLALPITRMSNWKRIKLWKVAGWKQQTAFFTHNLYIIWHNVEWTKTWTQHKLGQSDKKTIHATKWWIPLQEDKQNNILWQS